MKNYTFLPLIIILLISFNSYSQNFAPVGAKWHYNVTNASGIYYILKESIKDTIVLGKSAKKTSETPNFLFSPNIIYEDSNKVYHYNSYSNQFLLLYNFNANQGDTVKVILSIWDTIPYLIDSVKIENIGGFLKKVQYITDLTGCWDFGTKFIESIGSNRYFFPIQCTYPPDLPDSLRCYSDSLINYQLVPDCEEITIGVTEVSNQENKYHISTIVHDNLQLPAITGDLLIYDLQGKLIKNEKIKSFINLENMNQGIYILILKNDELFIQQKLIKF